MSDTPSLIWEQLKLRCASDPGNARRLVLVSKSDVVSAYYHAIKDTKEGTDHACESGAEVRRFDVV